MDERIALAPGGVERLLVAVVAERDEPLEDGVDFGGRVDQEREADLRTAARGLPVRVERLNRLACVPGEPQPAAQGGLDVRLSVSVLGNVEPELPVERERAPHVLDDYSDQVQLSVHPQNHPDRVLARLEDFGRVRLG